MCIENVGQNEPSGLLGTMLATGDAFSLGVRLCAHRLSFHFPHSREKTPEGSVFDTSHEQ